MKQYKYVLILIVIVITIIGIKSCQKEENDQPIILPPTYEIPSIETKFGTFYIWLYNETPVHKNNFLELINKSFYDSLTFHKTIQNVMVYTGDPLGTGAGGPGYTIPPEFDTSLTHIYGAVGAYREGNHINPEKASNGSQFYIVQDSRGQHQLDMEYTVFGFVFKGMDVIEQIANVAVENGYKPIEDIFINKVSILKLTKEELLNNYQFEIPE